MERLRAKLRIGRAALNSVRMRPASSDIAATPPAGGRPQGIRGRHPGGERGGEEAGHQKRLHTLTYVNTEGLIVGRQGYGTVKGAD